MCEEMCGDLGAAGVGTLGMRIGMGMGGGDTAGKVWDASVPGSGLLPSEKSAKPRGTWPGVNWDHMGGEGLGSQRGKGMGSGEERIWDPGGEGLRCREKRI